MAGEFEDSYGFSFQADSVHSGSISFGRFENELLSWERRSSFSHNRYLEEVEKCSRHGSVNEKKAYFEAHFRKKLLLQQTGIEHQHGGHDSSESTDYREEVQVADTDSHFCHFDESPGSSEYGGGESEVRSHCAEESRRAEMTIEIITMEIVPVEAPAETKINTEQGPQGDEKEEEVSPEEVISLSQHNEASETIRRTVKSHPPPQVADSVELKPRKVSPKAQPSVAPSQKHVPLETAEGSHKKLIRSRGTTPIKTNKERPSQRISSKATRSVRGISSSDDGDSLRAKVMPENGSVREPKGKKLSESSPLASNKIRIRGASTGGSRPRPREDSMTPEANPKTGSFSFKSNERAEKRK